MNGLGTLWALLTHLAYTFVNSCRHYGLLSLSFDILSRYSTLVIGLLTANCITDGIASRLLACGPIRLAPLLPLITVSHAGSAPIALLPTELRGSLKQSVHTTMEFITHILSIFSVGITRCL